MEREIEIGDVICWRSPAKRTFIYSKGTVRAIHRNRKRIKVLTVNVDYQIRKVNGDPKLCSTDLSKPESKFFVRQPTLGVVQRGLYGSELEMLKDAQFTLSVPIEKMQRSRCPEVEVPNETEIYRGKIKTYNDSLPKIRDKDSFDALLTKIRRASEPNSRTKLPWHIALALMARTEDGALKRRLTEIKEYLYREAQRNAA